MTRIIIPTCDRPTALTDCVLSIQLHTDPTVTPYEIVIVDSGTHNAMTNIRHIRTAPDIGFSRAVNEGAKDSTADYIVWLNDDAIVKPGWLCSMISYMDVEKDVGIGVFFFSDARWPDTGHHVFFYRNEVYPNFGCVRREVWEKLNGFDCRFFSYGAETDIGRRCRLLGYRVQQVANARVHHKYLKDEFRKRHVKKINTVDYAKLRLETYGPESDDNLHWMDELGNKETHAQYNARTR